MIREGIRKWSGKLVRAPLLLPFLAGCCGVAGVDSGGYLWWLPVLLMAFIVYALRGRFGLFFLAAVVAVLSSVHGWRLVLLNAQTGKVGDGKVVAVDLLVMKKVGKKRYFAKIVGSNNGEEFDDRLMGARVLLSSDPGYLVGDYLRSDFGYWMRPSRLPRNPGNFNEKEWLWRNGVALVAGGNSRKLGEHSGLVVLRGFDHMRSYVKGSLAQGLVDPDQIKVIHSMFLGERYGQDDPVAQDYRLSGAMHVFAVSGLHVMLIGGMALFFLNVCRVPRKTAIPVAIALMVLYTGITGWGIPAVRATVMAAFFVSGFLIRRRPRVLSSLAASGILLLGWNSHQLFSVGFQLTYGVVGAIVLLNTFWMRRFAWIQKPENFIPLSHYSGGRLFWLRLRKKLAEGLSVSFSAWMGSAPLIAWYFKLISPIGLIIGVPIVLTLSVVMWLGFASVMIGSVSSSTSKFVNQLNGCVAGVSRSLAGTAADVPMGHFRLGQTSGESIEIFDMREGGAVYFNLGGGVLLDVGGKRDDIDLLKSMQTYQRGVDSVIFSHGDTNHVGGGKRIFQYYQPKQLVCSSLNGSGGSEKRAVNNIKGYGARVLMGVEGDIFPLSDQSFIEIIYNGYGGSGSYNDDKGLVIMLHWKGKKMLFMNDAGYFVEQYLQEKKIDVKADVLVVGRHSRQEGVSLDFVNRVRPDFMIATDHIWTSDGPRRQRNYGWRKSMQEADLEFISQYDSGAVSLTINSEGELLAKPFIPAFVERK